MSDRATRVDFIAASNAQADNMTRLQHLAHVKTEQVPAPSIKIETSNGPFENSGDRDLNSSLGGDREFFLDEFKREDSQETQNSSKIPHNGMETRIIVPHRSVKSSVSVGSGKLEASSGTTGSLSVRLSLSNKRSMPVKTEQEGGKLTGEWTHAVFMQSSNSVAMQAIMELKVQMWWSEKFAAGRVHSMIRCDEEIEEVEMERVDSFNFLDEVKEAEAKQMKAAKVKSRLTESRRLCCSHPGCTKQAQTKGKCIAHGGVRECKEPGCMGTAKWRGRCNDHGGRRTCSKADCEKLALSGGKCLEHGGGGGKTCSFPSCLTRPQKRGLCSAHGGYIVCKTEGCERRAASKGLCTHHTVVEKCKFDGCEKAGSNRGYCYKHGVETGAIKVSRKPKCKEEGCVKIQLRQGYCSRHAQEHGFSVGRTCKAEGCSKVAQAGGLCGTHGGGTRCKVTGCNKSIVTKGLCSTHGGRKTCKVEGCEKWGLSAGGVKGYCVEHGGGYRCKHPGCSKSVQYNGLCCTHGGRLKCEAKECNKTVRVKGYCPAHQSTM